MKSRTLTLISVMTFFAALALSVQLSAQALQTDANSALLPDLTRFPAAHPGNVIHGFLRTAGGTITLFDPPGSKFTCPQSINDGGAITGYYFASDNTLHSFLRTADGTITSFDPPGAQQSAAESINDEGAITGAYLTPDGAIRGYLRTADGTFTTFDAPGAYYGTWGESIDDAGTIAGRFEDRRYEVHGFVLTPDGNLTTFDAPGAVETWVNENAMNASGAITGSEFDGNGVHGYLRSPDGSLFPTFDVYGALATYAEGITPNQTIVGYYLDKADVFHGFLRARNGTITKFQDPLAGLAPDQGTEAHAINPAGTVTGTYADGNDVVHGFVRNQHGVFTTFDVPGVSGGTYPQAINPAGAITGCAGGKCSAPCSGSLCATSCTSNCAVGLACTSDANCASNACDEIRLVCDADQCADHRKDGNETDIDCGGGTCPTCSLKQKCNVDTDCSSNACDGILFVCDANQCTDHRKDGNETDTDCGGGTCGACATGKKCTANTDCSSNACDFVSGVCVASTCQDQRKDVTETDVDCGGGTCPACANGLHCVVDTDCTSNACDGISFLCVANQCADHRTDGSETDVDCGGGTCPACANGLHCVADNDCSSNACDATSHTCVSNQCFDHHQDGSETDVDCGGPNSCSRCASGKSCLVLSDCTSGLSCTSGVCQ